RPGRDLGADPAPGRLHRLRRRALLLALNIGIRRRPVVRTGAVVLSCTHEMPPRHAPGEPADMTQAEPQTEAAGLGALGEIEREVLWLSTAIVHYANRVRPNPGGLKVGGHQASSASMVSIMTSLWFRHLRGEDRVSVK